MNRIFSTKKTEKGQGLVEYALLSIFVGIFMISVLTAFGPEIKAMALNLMGSFTGGSSVENGNLIIPGLSPSSTPVPPPSPTPTIPACTPGNALNIPNKNACKSLRDMNNCDNFNYSSKKDTCSWH